MDKLDLLDSVNAITQWQSYGNDQLKKSHGGYFSKGGWAYEKLEKLRIELEKSYKEQTQKQSEV